MYDAMAVTIKMAQIFIEKNKRKVNTESTIFTCKIFKLIVPSFYCWFRFSDEIRNKFHELCLYDAGSNRIRLQLNPFVTTRLFYVLQQCWKISGASRSMYEIFGLFLTFKKKGAATHLQVEREALKD